MDSYMTISLICACKNRNEPLQIALSSWLLRPEITEIIIVDWSSTTSLASLTKLDSRIKVITVQDQKYFNQPQPLNLAASIATGDYILKVDCDYIINPYYDFFEKYKIDENSFVSGKHNIKNYEYFNGESYVIDKDKMCLSELMEYANSYSQFFRPLTGLLFISRQNFMKVGGYNEKLGKYYAYEDDEMFHRLRVLGLEEKKLNFDYNILHIPHSDKKRTENFEGYDETYLNDIKNSLVVEDNQIKEWNAEYIMTMNHIETNKNIAPLTDEYYTPPLTKWNIQRMDEQNYYASKIMEKNKLENFPSVYYVSLEECKDRQDNIERQFAEYGITPTPIISKRFAESDDEITGKFLDQLNEGTTGCVISHLKAIRKWYEETDEDYAFFCEDDLSLETIQYWDFTWEEFVKTIPDDALCVQLLVIRKDYETFDLRRRLWDDWSGTAYIITRDYAKVLVEHYCLEEKRFHLELPGARNVLTPLLENVLFETLEDVCYTIPLFVEDIGFGTTFSPEEDKEVNGNQKNGHTEAYKTVLNYWKNKMKSFTVTKKTSSPNEIETLLQEYSADPENAENNFNLGVWYWNEKHTAPALSYFLRSAERAEDSVLAYEALLWAHQCYERQGTRDATARTLLQHAINLLPTRPEAYFLLAKFHGKREQWTDTYSVSHQGLIFSEKNLTPLQNNVGYMGEFALLYEKAIAAWWWGKSTETRQLLQEIKNNYKLPEQYEKSVQDLLMSYGAGDIPEEIIKYNKSKYDRLKYKFPGSENIEKNYSQAYQDMFVLSILNGKRNGTYLEIGTQEPFYQNNSALLETQFDWKGISIEIREDLCKKFAEERTNQILCKDATKINYEKLLDEFNQGTDIDYLQVDCEPSKTTFEILTAIPFEKYRFAVITYEHDHSVDVTGSYRDKSRRFLKSFGYELAVKDVAPNDDYTFEDWWIHPELIDPNLLNQMRSVDVNVTNVVKYFFAE
jgi:GR25 family glycosyltransferase involved in LPS biosynthesis